MTYTEFVEEVVDSKIYQNISSVLTIRKVLNRAVRDVINDLDLVSTKRVYSTPVHVFDEVYDYLCMTDLKARCIIDIYPQVNRKPENEWRLTNEQEFDLRKSIENNLVTIKQRDNQLKILRISFDADNDQTIVSELDSISENGANWTIFGDGTNLRVDLVDYIRGIGSLTFDISSAGGTTAGITHSSLEAFDITDYVDSGSAFVLTRITSATNITNYKLVIKSSVSDYYTLTTTTANDGTSFRAGWNLLRFDFSSAVKTGTPDLDNCTMIDLYMTKTGAKISETNYKFDQIILANGKIFDISYYSEYGWQTSAGVYIQNSTADTDVLNAGSEEWELFVLKAKQFLAQELKDYDEVKLNAQLYKNRMDIYIQNNPTEAMNSVTLRGNI